MNFDEIYLTKKQSKLLEILNISPIYLDNDNSRVCRYLESLAFVEIGVYANQNNAPKNIPGLIAKTVSITPRGQSYLEYVKGRRRSRLRDLAFSVFGGCIVILFERIVLPLLQN